jgi:hypothetical protein
MITPEIFLEVKGSPIQTAATSAEKSTVVEFRIAAREAVMLVSANAMSEKGIAACSCLGSTNDRLLPEGPSSLRSTSRPHAHLELHHLVDVVPFFRRKVVHIFGHQHSVML